MKAYHNKGFGMAFFVVFLLLVPVPILALWAADGQDWVDRFTYDHMPLKSRPNGWVCFAKRTSGDFRKVRLLPFVLV